MCVAVVPSGGRTGLAAGAVAANGELVLSLARMRRMDPVDVLGATVRVQAGAVTEAVHQHTAPHGLTWPVDFASKGSSQVGGNIATNAGGVKVIRYGLTRQWVLGLEVVLPGGEVVKDEKIGVGNWDYLYEPDPKTVLDQLLVRYLETAVYQAAADNIASEQSARMVAMKAASDNAKNIIGELQLVYNKSRQAAITKELSEIVGGAAAV